MSAMLQRATLLYQQDRYDAAADAARQHLTTDPESAEAHHLLALCLLSLDQLQQATVHAQQAIALEPTEAYTYVTMATVMLLRNRLPEAKAAAERAVALDPGYVQAFSLLARIHYNLQHWQEALHAANQGLALDPDSPQCLNLRAMAEIKLGRTGDAATTLQDALKRSPDNAWAHANQGWLCLEKGDHARAVEHFKEALRLKPEDDHARAGLVEAIKARNFIYRSVLYYFLWISKFSTTAQWAIVIGGFVGFQFLSNVADKQPGLWPYLLPVLIAYSVFALLTWLATPLFNLMLRLHPIGKYAVNDDQKRGANVLLVGLLLIALVLGLGLAYARSTEFALQATLYTVLIVLPSAMIYNCDEGWPRVTAWGLVAALAALGMPLILFLIFASPGTKLPILIGLVLLLSVKSFVWAAIGAQFAMNYLMSATVRR